MKWKDLFAPGLTINGFQPAIMDLKQAWVDIFAYEVKDKLSEDLKIIVMGEWPLEKTSLPLYTIVRLVDSNDARFLGEYYGQTDMAARQRAEAAEAAGGDPVPDGMGTKDPGQDTLGFIFNEVLEVTVWADNKELADALNKFTKCVVMAYSQDFIRQCDLQSFTLEGGQDVRGYDMTSGRPIFWRPYTIRAGVPFRLVKPTEIVRATNVRQKPIRAR